MATLAGFSGRSLAPDFSQGIGILERAGVEKRQDQRRVQALELQAQEKAQRTQALTNLGQANPKNLANIAKLKFDLLAVTGDPAMVQAAENIFNSGTINEQLQMEKGRKAGAKVNRELQNLWKQSNGDMTSFKRNASKVILTNPNTSENQKTKTLESVLNASNDKPDEMFLTLLQNAKGFELIDEWQKTNNLIRRDAAKKATFEPVLNAKGEVIAQRNTLTGEIKKSPVATGGALEKGTFTKGTTFIQENADGTSSLVTPILDSRGGVVRLDTQAVGGQLASRLGETPSEISAREVKTAGEKTTATLGAEAEGIGAVKKAEVVAKGRAGRAQTRITKGIEAGSSLPILNRGIQLLASVKTGGFDAVRLRAKQLFGVESANEAELSSNVGKAVLQQLRSTFGAAFTENEGNRLQSIEANIGKSTAGNIRLLNQAKKIALDAAKRGLRQARAQGDKESVQEIQDFIDFDLGAGTEPAKPARKAAGQIGKFTFREK